jgi:hypothetical protein
MLATKRVRLVNIPLREYGTLQILSEVILQSEEDGGGKHPAARFQIRINACRVRRVLLPVGELVTIRAKKKVHELLWMFCETKRFISDKLAVVMHTAAFGIQAQQKRLPPLGSRPLHAGLDS